MTDGEGKWGGGEEPLNDIEGGPAMWDIMNKTACCRLWEHAGLKRKEEVTERGCDV